MLRVPVPRHAVPRDLPRGVPAAADRPCECGHAREAHEHYRRGTDCALCSCPRYRAT